MSRDSTTRKTLLIALSVCLVCSLLVSTTAVSLKSLQKKNEKQEELKNIIIVADLYSDTTEVLKIYEQYICPEIVNLETGEFIPETAYNDTLNPDNFEVKTFSRYQRYSQSIPADQDIAGINRRPTHMMVYKVIRRGDLRQIILPVHGKGLWSTMYGFIALGEDLQTVTGLTFYEHGETPGLGGEIGNPDWQAKWEGKKIYGPDHQVRLTVIKGQVASGDPQARYKVDGISGATLTTNGVDRLVKYWLGENGYGPFLKKLAAQEG